jgi:HIV-1 Vpr-binding protein
MEAAMDEQANQAQAEEPQPQSRGGGEEEEEEPRNEDEELIAKSQKLMEKINSLPENPSPLVLHSLASLLETQESRYGFFFLFFYFLFFIVLISFRIWADWWVMI